MIWQNVDTKRRSKKHIKFHDSADLSQMVKTIHHFESPFLWSIVDLDCLRLELCWSELHPQAIICLLIFSSSALNESTKSSDMVNGIFNRFIIASEFSDDKWCRWNDLPKLSTGDTRSIFYELNCLSTQKSRVVFDEKAQRFNFPRKTRKILTRHEKFNYHEKSFSRFSNRFIQLWVELDWIFWRKLFGAFSSCAYSKYKEGKQEFLK